MLVLPFADANPTRRRAVITGLLVAANVVVFLVLQPRGGCPEAAFLLRWAAVPRELVSLQPLTDGELTSLIGPACAATVGEKSVLLSAFTAMFLHGNLAHLLGNMLFLWVFGNNVEDRLGRVRFLVFYAVGGLAATTVFVVLNADSPAPLVGASGAIAAILGAYLILYPRASVYTYVPFPLYLFTLFVPGARVRSWWLIFAIVMLPAWLVLMSWFVLQVLASGAPQAEGVAYSAHVAGFLAGIFLLLLLDVERTRRGAAPFHTPRRPPPRW